MTNRETVERLAELLQPWGEVRVKPYETVETVFGGHTEPYPGAVRGYGLVPERRGGITPSKRAGEAVER
jgi:hypothetical protein